MEIRTKLRSLECTGREWVNNRTTSSLLMGRRLSLLMTFYILEQRWMRSEEQLLTSKTGSTMPQLLTTGLVRCGVRHRSLINWNSNSTSLMYSLFCCMAVRRGDWRERILLDLKCSTCHVAEEFSKFTGGQRHPMMRSSDAVNNEQLLRWLRSEDGDILVTAFVARILSLILVSAGHQKEAGAEVDLKRHGVEQPWSSSKVSTSSHGQRPVRLRKIGTGGGIMRRWFWRNIPPGILHLKSSKSSHW